MSGRCYDRNESKYLADTRISLLLFSAGTTLRKDGDSVTTHVPNQSPEARQHRQLQEKPLVRTLERLRSRDGVPIVGVPNMESDSIIKDSNTEDSTARKVLYKQEDFLIR
jgi:hypothetical protein